MKKTDKPDEALSQLIPNRNALKKSFLDIEDLDGQPIDIHDLDSISEPTPEKDMVRIDKQKDLYNRNQWLNNVIKDLIIETEGREVFNYLASHVDLSLDQNVLISTKGEAYIKNHDIAKLRTFIDLKNMNNRLSINKNIKIIYRLLPDAGLYIGCADTYESKRNRIVKKFGKRLGKLFLAFDFVAHRVLPRIKHFTNVYFKQTKGKFYSVSVAEALGRVAFNGFEIIEYKFIKNKLFYVAMKTNKPSSDRTPSFGPLVQMKRIGKNGNLINVYKFRTMHPYSEFIQDFVIKLNGYNEVGKPANDFRVTKWGKLIRKIWVDELPQLINVLKGEMKLVGIRPLSKVRFGEFPEDLQVKRIKYKPGCFPPYVALNMPDAENNIEAERIYLSDLDVDPYFTDVKYFMKSVYNIITNKIRSS